MTQQDDSQDGAAEIQRQFAQLQAEMQRVMAEPPPSDATRAEATKADAARTQPIKPLSDIDEAADFQRLERGLDELRRDADRLRQRMAQATIDAPSVEAIAALRARIEEIGKRADDANMRLARVMQADREMQEEMAVRLDALSRRRPSRWLLPLAILLGAIVIAGAVLVSNPGPTQMLIDRVNPPRTHAALIEAPPPAPASLAASSLDPAPAAPPSAAPPSAATPPVPVQTVVAAPQPAIPPVAVPPAAEPPVAPPAPAPEAVAAVEPPPPIPAPVPVAPAPPAVAPTAAAPAPAAPVTDVPAPAARIVLRAKSDAWVEVRNRQGAPLIARLLRAGETWTVPDQPSLALSTGNAGGLELLVDGVPAPSLGATGVVRRDVPLEADLVRAGRYAPAPPKPSTASR